MTQHDIDALAERYFNLSYRLNVAADACDGQPCYVAQHPELPGCTAHGATEQEALANLSAVRREYIQILLEKGVAVPLPDAIVLPYEPMPTRSGFSLLPAPARFAGQPRVEANGCSVS